MNPKKVVIGFIAGFLVVMMLSALVAQAQQVMKLKDNIAILNNMLIEKADLEQEYLDTLSEIQDLNNKILDLEIEIANCEKDNTALNNLVKILKTDKIRLQNYIDQLIKKLNEQTNSFNKGE